MFFVGHAFSCCRLLSAEGVHWHVIVCLGFAWASFASLTRFLLVFLFNFYRCLKLSLAVFVNGLVWFLVLITSEWCMVGQWWRITLWTRFKSTYLWLICPSFLHSIRCVWVPSQRLVFNICHLCWICRVLIKTVLFIHGAALQSLALLLW